MARFIHVAAVLGAILVIGMPVRAEDRHAGYYYPEPQSNETYHARAQVQADSSRATRIGFVTELSNQMMQGNPYPPPFHIFAKGDGAEKMIIVASGPGMYDTLYRIRGLLAALTANARGTPFFQDHGVEDFFTFFDLARLLGFERITVSDGDTFAHQIFLE
ncbi:MAG: molybdopterin-guanine dinucleotide biosynthesis protein A [Rhodospirillaceae bacterium]|nr:molybdopterin-guanine dinucleotide biosynthesis protein A [Rhodospirillaceae bacterium]MBT6118660.1 molybdopterin-guanine dinucleotide biosynthesis protein A [Rhodospirillaceae bacterium]